MNGTRLVPLLVFAGAGLGGVARYAVGLRLSEAAGTAFPWGTLLVNVTGSLLITIVYGVIDGGASAPGWRAFLGVGILGGYTTFSAYSYESVRLLQDGEWGRATLYVLGSVALSLAAAMLGVRIATALVQRG